MSMCAIRTLATFLLMISLCQSNFRVNALEEYERIEKFYERNYTWPPTTYVPNTEGWRNLLGRRFRQAAEIPRRDNRYDAYLTTIQAALVAPNFTEYGFGLTRAPEPLMEDLRRAIHEGVANGPPARTEGKVDLIEGEESWFIDRPDMLQRVLDELQHIPEQWVDMDLTPNNAYGFRLYRNGSHLNMHIDKPQTHVISFILHIDSSDDAEPWPLLIEGFDGNTHEVVLTSGDMLLYESSKCLHGRPHKFKGSWYTSVFVHYYPKDGWAEKNHLEEIDFAVPPKWDDDLLHPTEETQNRPRTEIPLQMVAAGMKEPSCPNEWCGSQTAVPFSHGPGIEGVWVGPTGEHYPLRRTHKEKISEQEL